ncbi:hypothetical protein GGTG_13186 [Gaeumannomyces tritici R3-111a-1]|uniref:Zn(2)-C6 fungal-type domain-containing protein n=1 Tax=Gaeumannomyces tritici (strain R3-111a-1) TaxID=644352 RepID=J3PI57_GAET3|nr:hypothetical protein GGTG_13186 [Gaeumannomyces tritici R3-111a-1]EJT69570.1 hypothetical protein GGTG_13186 [Gaeumannomyces tritici R3-111a-1]
MEPQPNAAPSSVPRRRNGRQQACEPCRKRKLACDHSLPSCQRCRRRNAEAGCVYLITGTASGSAARRSTISPRAVPPDRHAPPSARPSPTRSPSSSGIEGSREESPAPMSPPTSGCDSPGYLGPTSFSAVFAEAGDQFASPSAAQQQHPAYMANAQQWTPPSTGPRGRSELTVGAESTPAASTGICPEKMEDYIRVLRSIPPADIGELLYNRNYSPMDGWVRPAMMHIIASIWGAFGEHLACRTRKSLAAMAELICANSSKALDEEIHEPQDWLASFSGRNLRWESLGIAFVVYAFGAMEYTPAEYAAHTRQEGVDAVDPRQLMLIYKECAIKCGEFCKEYGANSLLLCLSYKNGALESMVSSDTSLRNAVMMSETTALCLYLGMHVDPAQDRADKKPSISYEARRRLFYGIMVLDKAAAIVTGRPPLLNSRYISTKLPLDLTNEELMGSRSGLIEAAARLDSNGWNLNPAITPVKYMRSRIDSVLVRDEILEIALGGPNVRPNHEQLVRLKERELRQTAQMPEVLVWKPENVYDQRISPMELFGKVMMRLEHLQNMFFIERLLGRTWPLQSSAHGSTAPTLPPSISAELLTVSVEIVTLTVTLWMHRDRVAGVQRDFQWLIISYAAPAGGVLCMELLRQSQHAQTPRRDDATPTIARSNMILQLSLLVGFLGWTGPGAANARLCAAVKEAIQRVLNQVLDAPPAAVSATVASGPAMGFSSAAGAGAGSGSSGESNGLAQGAVDHAQQHQQQQAQQEFGVAGLLPQIHDFGFSTDITEFFNFELLDTFDFLRPEYSDLQT